MQKKTSYFPFSDGSAFGAVGDAPKAALCRMGVYSCVRLSTSPVTPDGVPPSPIQGRAALASPRAGKGKATAPSASLRSAAFSAAASVAASAFGRGLHRRPAAPKGAPCDVAPAAHQSARPHSALFLSCLRHFPRHLSPIKNISVKFAQLSQLSCNKTPFPPLLWGDLFSLA